MNKVARNDASEGRTLLSRRRRMPRCNEPWGRTPLVTAAAVLLCLGYCGIYTEAFTFGVRPLVVRPTMLATAPSTFRKRLPVSTKTHLQMVLSMSTSGSSVPPASCNATEGPAVLVTDTTNVEDDRFHLDQLLFEKQALEQRARLEQILLASGPRFSELSEETDRQLKDSTVTAAAVTDDDKKTFFGIALSDIWKARVLLLAAAALYGTNFSLVKILGDTMPVEVSGVLRFGMASLVTLPWLLSTPPAPEATTAVHGHQAITAVDGGAAVQQRPKKTNWWDDLVLMITGHNNPAQQAALAAALAGFEVGMWNSVGYVAQAVGLETTAASKSAFLCSLAVVTVPLLDFFVGKRLLPKQIIGALLAVAGVGFLELGGASGNIFTSLDYGDLASLVQPLAFGMGFWRMENAMSQYPQHAARSTAAQMMAVFCAYAAYCAVACGVTHSITLDFSQILGWLSTPSILFSLFWTGVITTALTVYMETLALKTLSAAETTLIFSTEPLWGTAFAAVIMGEQLGMDAAMGAVLILSGCLFSNLGLDGLKALTQRKLPATKDLIDPVLPEEPAPVLVRSGIAGAIGSWVSGLGEAKCVTDVAVAAAAEELEHLDDIIQTMNEIL